MEVAKRAAAHVFRINPGDAAAHVVLANTYSATGNHTKATELRHKMIREKIHKVPGTSYVVDRHGKAHIFYANHKSHPNIKEIYAKWDELAKLNYKGNLNWVHWDESDEKKALRLCRHSEKLALCFALLCTPPTSTIYIVKNLRMCGDCHETTAIISKIVQRKIVVRDARVFHQFENGKCKCGGVY